ncbi:TonB-dependent receptor [Neptunicella sp.]|uniref:TonB-dependent receptor n=1 Tax=Neptunicella sp. TaxID=2125986 RepID=UPI003F6925C2
MTHSRLNKVSQSIKLALCIGTASTAALFPAAVNAQEEQAAKASDVEVIQVSGIRASQRENLNNKRFSDSIVDSITAEDIGKFPDKNVAESLSRVTGVAVSREFGEGEKVSIRGAGPSLNRTLLNGQSVASADWFILDPSTRSFNYTLLPSSLVRSLDVYKSPQASIDEGSIGGTVILRTRRPLEMDANTLSLSIEGQYSDASGKTDPQLSGTYSWKNENETFGALISLVSQDRTLERQGLEILGWRKNTAANGDEFRLPSHIGIPTFDQKRERRTGFVSLQYAPTADLDMTLNILKSKMDSDNKNSNLLVRPNDMAQEIYDNATSKPNGNILASSAEDGWLGYNFINRVSQTQTQSVDLDVNYSTETYKVHGQIGTTKADGGTLRETSWEYTAVSDFDYDLTGTPTINTAVDGSDPSKFAAGWIWGGRRPTEDQESYGQLDLEVPIDAGPFQTFKTGAKYRQSENSITNRTVNSWHGPDTMIGNEDLAANYLSYIFAQCPTLADCGLTDGARDVDVLADGTLANQVVQNRDTMESIAFDGLNNVPADYAYHLALAEQFKIKENILALYAQGDFSGDNYRGNIGLRYVSTKQTSGGWEFSNDSSGLLTLNKDWLTPSSLEWAEVDNDYNEFLPSLNVAFNLDEDTILRVGAARVMARQNWQDISASETYGSLNQAEPTGVRNNPMLKPVIANQFDISYEWYYSDSSLLSATYFFKDIMSLRTSSIFVEPRFNQETNEYVDVEFTQPGDGLGGSINGIELNWQHDFGGYGVQANYTYTDAQSDQLRDENVAGSALFDGTSRNMMNLTGFYEDDTFSARLMYNYRSEWYKGLHFNGDELWNDAYGQWDASATINLTETISVNLEAVNITDEEVREYNTDKDRLMSLYDNGRRFVVGVHLNF